MKGWIGTAIAGIAIIITLFLDPNLIAMGKDITSVRFVLVAVLLSLIGVAFVMGQQTSEIFISRYVAFWSAVLGFVTVGAVNIDLLTNTHVKEAKIEKPAVDPKIAIKKRAKAAKRAVVHHPDTLKINRVERIVKQSDINPLAREEQTRGFVKNKLSEKNAKLPNNWQPTLEEKERFEAFLKQQGLSYDPKTAFKTPPPSNNFGQDFQ